MEIASYKSYNTIFFQINIFKAKINTPKTYHLISEWKANPSEKSNVLSTMVSEIGKAYINEWGNWHLPTKHHA